MKMKPRLLVFGITPLVMSLLFAHAMASSTDVVLNLEGNPTCSSLGDNAAVLEYRDSSPGTKSIILPTAQGGTQTLDYVLGTDEDGNAEISFWEISSVASGFEVNPINYVILKAQGGAGARVFHFGAAEDGDGAISDSDESARGSRLAAVSFCYGLTTGFDEPPTPEPEPPIADCADFTDPNTGEIIIDGTVIGRCPTNTSEERLLISLDLKADNFDVQSCTCNVFDANNNPSGLPVCDPELKVDEVPQEGQPGSCIVTDPNDPNEGINERVPVLIQAVETPNSYICYTIGGKRKCYGHF